MLEITKTQDDGSLKVLNLNEAVSGSWFNLINPTREEIQQVSLVLGLDESFLNNSLDADELSRMDFEDGNLLIITNVPIMDEEGNVCLPVKGGKWFKQMSVGAHLLNYDSMVALTHFKGHTQGGFGGSNKNIGIGCADGHLGKAWIHTTPGQPNQWDIAQEEFMERMTESTKATIDHFGEHVTYVNVMRNMSVSCDCEGLAAEPVVTPNVGILSSTDILAIDQACVDIIYAMTEEEHHALVERIESRHGLRQLSYMKELGMGNDRYVLIDLDNGGVPITAADAAKGLKPFVQPE